MHKYALYVESPPMITRLGYTALATLCLLILTTSAQASLLLSTTNGGTTVGGADFDSGDIIHFTPSPGGGTTNIIFDADALFPPPSLVPVFLNIDAVSRLANGNIVFSTTADFRATANRAIVPGVATQDGDLLEFNPTTGALSVFFEEGVIPGDTDIDAVAVLSDGSLALSLRNAATVGGQSFLAGDVFAIDRLTGSLLQSQPLFDQDLFAEPRNVDALSILANGNLVLSAGGSSTLGGQTFASDELIEFNPITGAARLFFDASDQLFPTGEDINAAHVPAVPEPSSLLLWGTLLATLALAVGPRR